jgi:nucleoside-diphosphate-sugar epimerase
VTIPKALISGMAGFTGYYLSKALINAGYQVHGMGANPSQEANYHQLDLSDVAAMRCLVAQIQPTVVVHLAAIAFVGHADPEAFYRVNLIGTHHLLSVLAEMSPNLECLLLVSSANIYGNANEGVLDENQTPAPENDYAVSKLAMENMAKLWLSKLPIVTVRPFNYTGVGQSEQYLLPKIVSHFKRKEKQIELGNLDIRRDFSDVRAVVTAYVGLIQSKPIGQVFNVCSGQATSLQEVLAMMKELVGYSIEVNVNPAFVRPNEVKILIGSADRLKTVLPEWQTITLRETLAWMLCNPA